MSPDNRVDVYVSAVLDLFGFDPNVSVLTRRQSEVLVLRERGLSQAVIATHLGTSRENVAKSMVVRERTLPETRRLSGPSRW